MSDRKMSFSERMGIVSLKVVQKDSMDIALKNKLWNVMLETFFEEFTKSFDKLVFYIYESDFYNIIKFIWTDYFNKPIDEIPDRPQEFIQYCRFILLEESKWHQFYDFIQFLLTFIQWKRKVEFIKRINISLEKENSAYRIVGNEVTLLTDEVEINELEEGLNKSQGKFNGVHTHLRTALQLLSDRQNPNYRKSIDESIMAVESICVLICNDPNATLGKALNKIERNGIIEINGTLKGAYSKIYGYTSSDDGIRHALIKETNLDYEDAKYMLVSCTSFINYLIVKAEKSGVFSVLDEVENDE